MNDHRRAVRLAEETNSALGVLFDKMGNAQHPRSGIVAAYARARKALARNLGNPDASRAILGQLRRDVERTAAGLIVEAAELGYSLAREQATLYGLQLPLAASPELPAAYLNQWMMPLDAQINIIRTMQIGGQVDALEILGDQTRTGLLSPALVTRDGARWLTSLVSQYGTRILGPATGPEPQYKRQVVATLDQFTTDCCLRAHGQVVDYDQPFHLVGTPRFADYLMETPFHWNCRSVTVLIPVESVEDDVTLEMRDAARAEIDARERTGKREEIWPSHARSRRH